MSEELKVIDAEFEAKKSEFESLKKETFKVVDNIYQKMWARERKADNCDDDEKRAKLIKEANELRDEWEKAVQNRKKALTEANERLGLKAHKRRKNQCHKAEVESAEKREYRLAVEFQSKVKESYDEIKAKCREMNAELRALKKAKAHGNKIARFEIKVKEAEKVREHWHGQMKKANKKVLECAKLCA